MNPCIPPKPPRGKDPAAIARLVRFRDSLEGVSPAEKRERESRVLLGVACVLSFVGSVLLACALTMELLPHLEAVQAVQEMWAALF